MMKSFLQAWHYRISYVDNLFAVYLNDRLVGNIHKPSSGRWPVYALVNDRLYSFSKIKGFRTAISVTDEVSEEEIGVIKLPYFSSVIPYIKFDFANGEELVWEADNFFSLHWKWKKDAEDIMEAIENLTGERNSGVIAMPDYKKGADLLIMSGFFLSLLRRSKLSMGMRGLKRSAISLSRHH